jgi:hypothetical protein
MLNSFVRPMNAADHQNRPRIELVPGDYFVYEFEVRGERVFTYGLLERIRENGKYQADFKTDSVETMISCEGGRSLGTVARISKQAYELARLRGWPKSQTGAGAIIDYSAGKRTRLSFRERWKLVFVK